MKVLYIGQYSEGTTSKIGANQIHKILKPTIFDVVDTQIPFYKISKSWRSIGFRTKRGLLVTNINKYISKEVSRFKTRDSRFKSI